MSRSRIRIGIVLFFSMLATTVQAKMLFGDFSLSYLHGEDYKVGDNIRDVLTVEHASGHTWGDNFFFVDRLKSNNGDLETYFELSPRISTKALLGQSLQAGFIKDVLLALTWEGDANPYSQFNNYLTGIGFSFDVPGFRYFTANVYKVNNQLLENDEQLTLTWGLPFNIGGAEFLYDGFVDWSSGKSDHAAETNFTSQLKWNVGRLFSTSAPVYVGIEYAYWNNKFGIAGVKENNPCLLLKWHF